MGRTIRTIVIAATVLVTVVVSAAYVATGSVVLRTGLSQATIIALPVALALITLRAPLRFRRPLALTAVAATLYAAAEAVSVSLTVAGVAPYPNRGESLIALAALVNLVAFVMIVGPRPGLGRTDRLDIGIATTGVVLLFVQTGLLSFAGQRSGSASLAVAGPLVLISVAYLAVAVVLIGRPGGTSPGTSMLVGALSMVLADVAFLMSTLDGTDADGRLSDVGYIVTRGAFTVMVLQLGQDTPHRYRVVERYRVLAAGAVALLTPLGAVIGARTNPGGPEWLGVLALVLPVVMLTWRAVLTIGRLTEEAGVDHLTGLHSRRSIMDAIDRHCADGPHFVLVMCDLDGFKQVNDRYGHDVGDEVLVAVADQLRRSAADGATVARLGGDEFAVLVPRPIRAGRASSPAGPAEADIEAAAAASDLAERLGPALATLTGPAAGVGISLGAATGGPGSDPRDLLVRADSAMYTAKQASRTATDATFAGTPTRRSARAGASAG